MKAIKAMRQAAVTVTAAVALALTGCSGQEDFIDGGDTPAKGVMLTMTASTGVAGPDGTRAYLTEGDDKNPWLWEDKDELLVVNDAGKAIGTLTIKKGIGKEKGVFEGPVDGLTAGQKVRIFYLGPNTNTSRIVNGKIMFDFSKLNGTRESLKSLCALNAEGTVKMNGDKAGILEDVTLKNAFAAAHFSVKGKYNPLLGNTYKALVVHGDVPLQATVDAASGNIESTVMAGRESNVREGFVFTTAASPDAPYDIYLPLVPNKVATDKATLSFDIYTDKQTSKKIVSAGAQPATVGNSADAFVRTADGTPSVFTVSKDGKKVNFTDGNLQYMMPKQVYSLTVRKHIDPNILYRKGKDKPQELEAKYNVLKGYYRLAPEQWIMVPPTSYANNYYFGIYTCVQDNNDAWNVSCTTNPVFDMFFFGKPEHPTLVDKSTGKYFLPTKNTEYQGTDKDWTNYAKLSDSTDPLVTLSLSEWQYLIDTRKFPDDASTFAYALAFLDLNGNGTVESEVDQAGLVIFPDGMKKSTAMSLFTAANISTFGKNRTLEGKTADGYLGKILKKEAVTEKGCLFLPFPGWNSGFNGKNCKIEQISRHFNYWTSTSDGALIPGNVTMTHYNISISGAVSSYGGVSGNAVRLVRFVK
ncbi:hypothetical protein [Prevotella sp. DNF00663]|uniref:hypothetical protein n=1 Tax=Prevotella sp. DNF00663 TaxID=1384078 RepID=UPI0012E3E3CC|nr:hypothetical protein [Prevotella sp. DNF00663]